MSNAARERYQAEAGERYHRSKREVPEAAFDWVARSRSRKFAPHIRTQAVVFEYGAGYGWNLAALRCARKVGFDVTAFLRADLEKRGIEFVDQVERLSDAFADVIICHHVLEHLLHPPEALTQIHRLLRADGKLLLTVPAEPQKLRQPYNPAEPNHHLYAWTLQTLCNLVTDCGFQVVNATTEIYGYDRFAAIQAVRLGVGERGFRAIRALLQVFRPLREVHIVASKKL